MPHLDICTYIVQYNWTVITFLTLYVLISVKYLPQIGKILHTRLRKVTQVADIKEQLFGEAEHLLAGEAGLQSVIKANTSASIAILKNCL